MEWKAKLPWINLAKLAQLFIIQSNHHFRPNKQQSQLKIQVQAQETQWAWYNSLAL